MDILFLAEIGNGAKATTYAHFDDLAECTLEFTGALVTDNFDSYRGSVTPTRVEPKCDFDQFMQHVAYMEDILKQLDEQTSMDKLLRLQLSIDAASLDNILVDCYAAVDASIFLPVNTEENAVIHGCIDPTDTTDPCCDPYLRMFQCCAPKVQAIGKTFATVREDVHMEHLGCREPLCVNSFARELSVLRDPFRCSGPLETFTEFTRKNTRFWIDCQYAVFGRDSTSIIFRLAYPLLDLDEAFPCDQDSDCKTGTCNLFYHQCSIPDLDTLQFYNREFLECLLTSDIPTFVLARLVESHKREISENKNITIARQTNSMIEKYSRELCGPVNHLDLDQMNTMDLFQICYGMCFISFVAHLLRPGVHNKCRRRHTEYLLLVHR